MHKDPERPVSVSSKALLLVELGREAAGAFVLFAVGVGATASWSHLAIECEGR